MNDREKKLLFFLFGAGFIIANVFLYTVYSSGMQKMKSELNVTEKEYNDKMRELDRADERADEREWMMEHAPAEGNHRGIGTALAKFTEDTARRYGVEMKRRPRQEREDPNESGAFRSATVKVIVQGRDPQIVRWLTDLQDPRQSRSITLLKMEPQKNEPTQMDCELEVTQWFTPVDSDSVEIKNPAEASTR